MTGAADFWTLPGPSGFVERCAEVLRDGSSLVVRFPLCLPDRFADRLRAHAEEFLIWHSIEARAQPAPLRQLLAALGAGSGAEVGIHDLLALPGVAGRLFVAEIADAALWRTWQEFLEAYADISRSVSLMERNLFLIVLRGAAVATDPPFGVALRTLDFRDVVEELDLLLYARGRLRGGRHARRGRPLLAATVARIGMSDIELVDRLLGEPAERVLEPWPVLEALGRERGWSAETERAWTRGTVDRYEGLEHVHSALLAVSGEWRRLERRLWSAQAAVLLPVLEQRRAALVREVRGRLRLPVRTEHGDIDDPHDLELAHLAHQIDRPGTERRLRRAVRLLREARNHLAHLEPLAPGAALDVLGAGERGE